MNQRTPPTPEWRESVLAHYRDAEPYDWNRAADSLIGPETLFHRLRERLVRRAVAHHGAAPYLDAGCGSGMNLRHLPPGSSGIDINPRQIAIVMDRLPEMHLRVGEVESLPFADSSFATVLCTEVIEHLPSERDAITEIVRVLQPRGVAIFTVPTRSWLWRLRRLSFTYGPSEPFHREYTLAEIESHVVSCGLEIVESRVSFPPFLCLVVARKPA